jgi:hypothetical protein
MPDQAWWGMAARYDIKPEGDSWTQYDTTTGLSAEVNDAVQVGLSLEDADDLADLLNRIHAEHSAKGSHYVRRESAHDEQERIVHRWPHRPYATAARFGREFGFLGVGVRRLRGACGWWMVGISKMSETLSFSDAINASNSTARTILLGNGFSIAQAGSQFAYANLLEKSGLAADSPILNVFHVLNTFDFEIVMKALEDAAQIELAYSDKDRSIKFKEDAGAVREALIHAIRAVHPGVQFDVPIRQRDACAAFLKNFESIFTLSYDLLLYWVILHAATKEFQDGFGLGPAIVGFRKFNAGGYCNTHYLHGALHLFVDIELDTLKRILTNNTIIDRYCSYYSRSSPVAVVRGGGNSISNTRQDKIGPISNLLL